MKNESSQDRDNIDSERLYQLCAADIRMGWEEASRYVYGIISWKGWSLSRADKEDLVQETLLYFISGGLKRVKDPKAFKKLLSLKALGNIIDSRRKSGGRVYNEKSPPGPQIPSNTPDPFEIIFSNQAISICHEIIASMKDDRCKEILPQYFRYKAIGESIGRIARDMKKPVGTIASLIHRCLKLLYRHPQMVHLKAVLQDQV